MTNLTKRELGREELFLLVWERPAQLVAKELGISDVALGKLCKKLQVPKPPTGYWAKIQSGKRPRKPLLKEFSEQVYKRLKALEKKQRRQSSWIHLSPLQLEIFQRAVEELSDAGIDIKSAVLTRSGISAVDGELAAQIIILIQHRCDKWLRERAAGDRVVHGAYHSVQSLVSKLLPHAKEQILVLEREQDGDKRDYRGPKVIIRTTPQFIQRVADLYHLAVENDLSYAVHDLGDMEHAWVVQYHFHHDECARTTSQLCVSKTSLWVQCRVKRSWNDEQFNTTPLSLPDIAPVELIPKKELHVPKMLELPKLRISEKRIKAFVDADRAYDLLSSAVYKYDNLAPDDHLVLLEKIFGGTKREGPLTAARAVYTQLEEDFERWELALAQEREEICGEALGVTIGDTVVRESHGKTHRVKISQMSAYVGENEINFHLSGRRYRKDGILGKREEYIYISTTNNLY